MLARRNLCWLSLFAIAMAHVESALVVHLRSVYYPDDSLSLFPLSILSNRDLGIELGRELATLVMILSVSALVARRRMLNFAVFLFVFGVWDLFYYVWLKLMIDWPQTWLEWDVLYLIPWPWLGPWIAAVLIAALFVAWGAWVLSSTSSLRFTAKPFGVFVVGALLTLGAFLLPAAALLPGGPDAFRAYEPGGFPWILYSAGFALMALGLWLIAHNGSSDTDDACSDR